MVKKTALFSHDGFPNLLNLICVDLWEFWDKKVSFVAERPLEAEKRGRVKIGKIYT